MCEKNVELVQYNNGFWSDNLKLTSSLSHLLYDCKLVTYSLHALVNMLD